MKRILKQYKSVFVFADGTIWDDISQKLFTDKEAVLSQAYDFEKDKQLEVAENLRAALAIAEPIMNWEGKWGWLSDSVGADCVWFSHTGEETVITMETDSGTSFPVQDAVCMGPVAKYARKLMCANYEAYQEVLKDWELVNLMPLRRFLLGEGIEKMGYRKNKKDGHSDLGFIKKFNEGNQK